MLNGYWEKKVDKVFLYLSVKGVNVSSKEKKLRGNVMFEEKIEIGVLDKICQHKMLHKLAAINWVFFSNWGMCVK